MSYCADDGIHILKYNLIVHMDPKNVINILKSDFIVQTKILKMRQNT